MRHRVRALTSDVGEVTRRTFEHEWSVLTQQRGAASPIALLNELADMGFTWRDIARLVGVSVPAVQKWRKGERLSGDNRRKLAGLIAACDLVASHFYVDDVASWFEMPIHESAPVTPIDLWAAGEQMLLFETASRHLTGEEVLDRFQPEWRERYASDFETYLASDGELSIRMRER
jgi:transcriptional regulator with XRE-family HTH domain